MKGGETCGSWGTRQSVPSTRRREREREREQALDAFAVLKALNESSNLRKGREGLIEVLRTSMNFEMCAGKGPAEAALHRRLHANQGVTQAHGRMMAICNQVLAPAVGKADSDVEMEGLS